jgi:hypothetical protein
VARTRGAPDRSQDPSSILCQDLDLFATSNGVCIPRSFLPDRCRSSGNDMGSAGTTPPIPAGVSSFGSSRTVTRASGQGDSLSKLCRRPASLPTGHGAAGIFVNGMIPLFLLH